MAIEVSKPLKAHGTSKNPSVLKDKIILKLLSGAQADLSTKCSCEVILKDPVGAYGLLPKISANIKDQVVLTYVASSGTFKNVIAVINNVPDMLLLNALSAKKSKEEMQQALGKTPEQADLDTFQTLIDALINSLSNAFKEVGIQVTLAKVQPSELVKLDDKKIAESGFLNGKLVAVQGSLSVKDQLESYLLFLFPEQFVVEITQTSTGKVIEDISTFVGSNIEGRGKKKQTILVVEDITKIRAVTKLMLEQEGFNIVEASNGIEALNKLKSEKVELILCDIMMPQMDGFEFCEKIRQSEQYKDLPVIFLTALDKQEDIVKASKYTIHGYIVKPYQKKALISKINAVLEQTAKKS